MLSKYSTSAISFLLFVALTTVGYAQKAPSAPLPGYLRFWNMLPPASGTFDLRKAGSPPAEAPLIGGATAYRYSSYSAIPAGMYRLGVYKAKHEKTPLKVVDLNVTPDSFFTVLVRPGSVELINDTVDPKAESGSMTIRNYFPGTTISVSDGGKLLSGAVPYGQSFAVNNLALTGSRVIIQARLPGGNPAQFIASPDFKSSKHATVLVIPDGYGDFRPRVTVDGKNI